MATNENILYEPEERCPPLVSLAVGFQGAVILLVITVLVVSITLGSDSYGEEYLTWTVFAALILNGAITALQSATFWRFGAGHVLFTSTVALYVPVSRIALAQGGPALMASLVIVSSLFQFLLSAWLPLLRRIVTPVVSGIILLLVAAMTIPIAFDRVARRSAGCPGGGRVAGCRGRPGGKRAPGIADHRPMADVVSHCGDRRWLCCRRRFWDVRRATSRGRALDWRSHGRVAGYRRDAGR